MIHALVVYFVIVVAIETAWELHRQQQRHRQRQQWERTHEGLNWDDWKHVVR